MENISSQLLPLVNKLLNQKIEADCKKENYEYEQLFITVNSIFDLDPNYHVHELLSSEDIWNKYKQYQTTKPKTEKKPKIPTEPSNIE